MPVKMISLVSPIDGVVVFIKRAIKFGVKIVDKLYRFCMDENM